MAAPRQFDDAGALARDDWKARRRKKDEIEAQRPRRKGFEAARVHVLTESELRRDVARLLGFDPWLRGAAGSSYDHALGCRAVEFFHTRLTHVTGDRALEPVALEPWQQALLLCVYGWVRADGTRRFREVFVFVPRKNGKTTIAAGMVLYQLYGHDSEIGQQVYSCAADRDQAALIYEVAAGMVAQDPVLEEGFLTRKTTKRLEFPGTGSFYRALSAEAKTKHGLNPSMYVFDELHAQPDRELFDVMKTAVGARRSPLAVYITTSDFERESICNELHDYARKVRDGALEDRGFLPAIWEASRDDDWTDPAVWRRVNPNLGVSVTEEFLRSEVARAKESPEYQNTVLRLYLNVRTSSDVVWLPLEMWDSCSGSVDGLGGEECYGGLDLATTRDLTALVLYFPGTGAVVPYFWMPEKTAQAREKRGIKPSYVAWAREGHMELTPGNSCDYDRVRARINELAGLYDLREVAFDPWNATQLATQLQSDGVEMTAFRQGYASLSGPSKDLERRLLAGSLRHGGHPVLRWCAGNVMVEQDPAGNIKPSKSKSTDKIDGIVALVMALGVAGASDPVPDWSPEVFTA